METSHLQRKLEARHLEFIVLGGTIGSAIFIASGYSIATSGPTGAILGYVCTALFLYVVMSVLGEMATLIPISGSFNEYGTRFVDPAFGFAMGWMYLVAWISTLAAELAASVMLVHFWLPDMPSWIILIVFLSMLLLLNCIAIHVFGEIEFWLTAVKVFAIVITIFTSLVVVIKDDIGFKNFVATSDGVFPSGAIGVFGSMITAFYSFGGAEMIGVAAGESADPSKHVPRAVSSIFWSVSAFYILSIFMLSLLIPSTDPNLILSSTTRNVRIAPFTLALQMAHLPSASQVMNAVILIASLSTCNSSLYASSRVLLALAVSKQAPSLFSVTTSRGLPLPALLFSTAVGCICFLGALIGNDFMYMILMRIAGIAYGLTWIGVCFISICFRRSIDKPTEEETIDMNSPSTIAGNVRDSLFSRASSSLPYRAPFPSIITVFGILFGLIVFSIDLYTQFTTPDNFMVQTATCCTFAIFVVMFVAFKIVF